MYGFQLNFYEFMNAPSDRNRLLDATSHSARLMGHIKQMGLAAAQEFILASNLRLVLLQERYNIWGDKGEIKNIYNHIEDMRTTSGKYFEELGDIFGRLFSQVYYVFFAPPSGENDFYKEWHYDFDGQPQGPFKNKGEAENARRIHLEREYQTGPIGTTRSEVDKHARFAFKMWTLLERGKIP